MRIIFDTPLGSEDEATVTYEAETQDDRKMSLSLDFAVEADQADHTLNSECYEAMIELISTHGIHSACIAFLSAIRKRRAKGQR